MSKHSLWGCWNLVEWPHDLVKNLLGLLVVLLCYARVRGQPGVRSPVAFSLGEGAEERACSLSLPEGTQWPEIQGASSRGPSGQHFVSLQGTRHGGALSLHTWNLLSPPLHYLSPTLVWHGEEGTPACWGPSPARSSGYTRLLKSRPAPATWCFPLTLHSHNYYMTQEFHFQVPRKMEDKIAQRHVH